MSLRERWADLDARLVAAAKGIKILSRLAWPGTARAEFLRRWHAGRPRLPEVDRPQLDFRSEREAIERVVAEVGDGHSLERYLQETGQSYLTAARMLESCGTAAFTELAEQLYGSPTQRLAGTETTVLHAAERFLAVSQGTSHACAVPEAAYCVPARRVADAVRRRAEHVFHSHPVRIELSASLASKAAAGARRVRLRDETCFSEEDISQLVEHELLVHTLTAVNGRQQPHLKSLGLGAPRTTLTQEGLAVLAELITYSMDLSRLRRLALRPLAIQRALDGADFIEVFRFFLENGQSEFESFDSSYRVFRGGDVRGGIAFLKDGIYLLGLLSVHNFLRKAIEEQKLHYVHDLFVGRLALSDVVALQAELRSGFIARPLYEPEWVLNRNRLAAFLAYADFVHAIDLAELDTDALSRL